MKQKFIQPSMIGHFIAESVKLQNYDCVSYERGLFNIEFKESVNDISEEYSKYQSIVISELTGLVTLYSF